MEPRNDLDRLAVMHGTDKFHGYYFTRAYHRYFASLRSREIDLLEIGIGGYQDPNGGGQSLRMWKDYFPHGRIYGLDYHDKPALAEDRIRVFQGSQDDPRAIARLIDAAPQGGFDIVIDDGSHRGEHVIASFLMLFPFLRDGGWYAVENVEAAYYPQFGSSRTAPGSPFGIITFFQRLADDLNWAHRDGEGYSPSHLELGVLTVHFYRGLILIGKGP